MTLLHLTLLILSLLSDCVSSLHVVKKLLITAFCDARIQSSSGYRNSPLEVFASIPFLLKIDVQQNFPEQRKPT